MTAPLREVLRMAEGAVEKVEALALHEPSEARPDPGRQGKVLGEPLQDLQVPLVK